ncbi:phosphatase PAP2 family protein [Cellulomonas hominis]
MSAPRPDRYAADPHRPTSARVGADLLRRAVLPATGLWAVVVLVGLLIVGPLGSLPGELAVNRALESGRTARWDTITAAGTHIGSSSYVLAVCLLAVVVLWWRTRQWWLAVVPLLAVALQLAVFVTSALVVARPRPDVDQLDGAPPTSSYPSGHVGATTALYVTLAVLAQRVTRPAARWTATAVCLLVPVLVAYARLYRGMHHVSDVVVGALNGLVCCWLAWHYLRRAQTLA